MLGHLTLMLMKAKCWIHDCFFWISPFINYEIPNNPHTLTIFLNLSNYTQSFPQEVVVVVMQDLKKLYGFVM